MAESNQSIKIIYLTDPNTDSGKFQYIKQLLRDNCDLW